MSATRQQVFGLVFLALAAETARRDASEGRVWAPVRGRVADDAVPALFVQGQPNRDLKDAIESACRRWQLRHVFGQDGQQAWYASVYLQFGFTGRTIQGRLPARLANAEALPTAVEQLLYDSRLKSASFVTLWNTLLGVRHRNTSDRAARQVLRDSPWALTDWADELMQAAVSRMDLTPAVRSDEPLMPSLFTPPLLQWTDAPPRFQVELVNLADVVGELLPGAYRVLAGSVAAEFLVDESGTPHGLQPLHLPLAPAHLTATVERMDEQGEWEPIAAEDLLLWEPTDEVAVFRDDGHRLDAWDAPLAPAQSYILVLAPGLEVAPRPPRWVHTDGCLVVHLAAGWTDDLSVTLDGAPIWDPLIRVATGPARLTGVSVPLAGTPLGESPTLRIFGASHLVTDVWIDRQPSDFRQDGTQVETRPPVPDAPVQPSFFVRVRDNTGATRSGRIAANWLGAQHLRSDGWVSFPVSSIDQRDLGQRVRVFTPEWREPTLMLGNRPLGRISNEGRAVGLFEGWGAPLSAQDGRFNRLPDRSIALAEAVTSRGVVRDISREETSEDALFVTLRGAIDVDRSTFVALDRTAQTSEIQVLPTGERSLIVDDAPENALLILMEGELTGSYWWRPPLPPDSPLQAVRLMDLMRRGRAPLLSPRFVSWMSEVLRAHPIGGLALLFDLSLEGLPRIVLPSSEEFDPVARQLLSGWLPDPASVHQMADTMRQTTDPEGLADVAQRFPVPIARLLAAAFQDAVLRRHIRSSLLDGLGWGAAPDNVMLEEIGWQSDVAGGFLDSLGRVAIDLVRGRETVAMQQQNLLVAMNLSGDFRRWLAGRLISEL